MKIRINPTDDRPTSFRLRAGSGMAEPVLRALAIIDSH